MLCNTMNASVENGIVTKAEKPTVLQDLCLQLEHR